MFGFTHRGLCDLYSDTVGLFDLEQCQPERDAATRGVTDVPGGTPALDNRLQLWRVIRDHVERFLAVYYATVGDLRGDVPFTRWLDTLTVMIPKGVPELAGRPVTIAGAVELLATSIYLTTVEHEILDSNVYDYQLWNDVQPARVYENGAASPVDVYLRLVNYNFILSVERTLLMSDFSSLAPDDAGRAAFTRFREDLAALQVQMSQEPQQVWRLEPRMLRANMNY
jgi:arachidonate 15-lipoxygenase